MGLLYDINAFIQPRGQGPLTQIFLPNTPGLVLPLALGAGANFVSPIVLCDGYRNIAIAAQTSGAATLSVARFLDPAATLLQTAPANVSLAANVQNVLNLVDGLPFCAMIITISNAGALNLTKFGILFSAG